MSNPYQKAINNHDNCIFRVAAKAIIVADGRVLLVKDAPGDLWGFPGGGIDYGEDAIIALARELFEEISVPIGSALIEPRPVCVTAGHIKAGLPRVNIYYRVTTDSRLISLGHDAEELSWVDKEALSTIDFDPANGDMNELSRIVQDLLS